jgi:hypothetical protein
LRTQAEGRAAHAAVSVAERHRGLRRPVEELAARVGRRGVFELEGEPQLMASVKLDICMWCTKTLAECTCYGVD